MPELHRRAAAWHEQNGLIDEAIEHALAARDFGHAVHLIDSRASTLLLRGEMVTLLDWLAAVPEEILRAHRAVYPAAICLGDSPIFLWRGVGMAWLHAASAHAAGSVASAHPHRGDLGLVAPAHLCYDSISARTADCRAAAIRRLCDDLGHPARLDAPRHGQPVARGARACGD